MNLDDFKHNISDISDSIYNDSKGEFDIRNIEQYVQPPNKHSSVVELIWDNNITFMDFISTDTIQSIQSLRDSLQALLVATTDELKDNFQSLNSEGTYLEHHRSDDERERYDRWLEYIRKGLIKELENELKNQQIRDILFFGSECEEQGLIKINNEFTELNKVINSEFLKLHRVKDQTINHLRKDWIQIEPEIIVMSCHGSEYGLHIKDEYGKCYQYLNTDLTKLFEKRNNITECVILSACQSETLGKNIATHGFHVVYTNKKVHIDEATKYKAKFFEYLNMFAQKKSEVYYKAHQYSLENLSLHSSQDSHSFKYAPPETF